MVNVLRAMIAVMTMQLATTVQEVTPAHATLDTQEMGFIAQVSAFILYLPYIRNDTCLYKYISGLVYI